MDYFLSEELMELKNLARQFAEESIKPVRAKYDETGEFPWDIMKQLAAMDFFRIYIDEEYEGMGMGSMGLVLVTEELSRICGGIALGFAGIALGIGVARLKDIESMRGDWAAWAFAFFGLLYMLWGFYRAYKNKPHKHMHIHDGEVIHKHDHNHHNEKIHKSEHSHTHTKKAKNITPWVLFVIFVLGPCEPLIPLFMYPAAQNNIRGLIAVTPVFGIVTVTTMMSIVFISAYGIRFVSVSKLERYVHALAGGTIFLCGISIRFLGL